MVRTPADANTALKGEWIEQIGRVEYLWDQTDKKVWRWQSNYAQAIRQQQGLGRLVLSNVQKFNIQYLVSTPYGLEWKPNLQNETPALILLEIDYGLGQNKTTLTRLINIPIGG